MELIAEKKISPVSGHTEENEARRLTHLRSISYAEPTAEGWCS